MNHPIVLLYVDINKNLAICHHHFNLTHKFVFRSENGNYNLAKSTILWANLSSLVKNLHFILTLMILMKKRMKTKRLNDFQNQKSRSILKNVLKVLNSVTPFHKNSFVISAAKSVFTTGLISNGCSFLDLKVQSPLNTNSLVENILPNVKVRNCNFNDFKICQKSKPFNLDKQIINREEN